MSRRICLITGATGALGPGVAAAFGDAYDVRTLSRHAPQPGLFARPVDSITGDIADEDVVRQAVRGADVVVHLAALLHIVDPPPDMRPEYQRVNVGGTAAVINAARAEGVSRVVVLSTIAVYEYGGGVLSEESPPRPETFYGETKLAAERVALDARRADGVPLATVLRSAAVYGPRVKGNYRRLVQALARRRFVPIGPGDNRRTVVFEDDLASAIVLAAAHPGAAGRVYNISDGELHPLRDIIAAIARALGRRPPRWHAPIAPIRLALNAAAVVDRRFPRMLDKYLEEVAVQASRIQTELGFQPRFDLDRGWAATIDEMRRRGHLPPGS